LKKRKCLLTKRGALVIIQLMILNLFTLTERSRTMKTNFKTNLTSHLAAGYPLLFVKTYEEMRAQIAIKEACKSLDKTLYLWSVTCGLSKIQDNDELSSIGDTTSPDEVIDYLFENFKEEMSTIVLCDFHKFLNDARIMRMIRELNSRFKEMGNNIIFLSPIYKVPEELKKDITVVEFNLPTKKELGEVVNDLSKECEVTLTDLEREEIIDALSGLTTIEAENALSMSVCNYDTFRPEEVVKIKAEVVRKSGILEYCESEVTMNDVGGLDKLKTWLELRKKSFSKEAKAYGITTPRGILLVGIPGCGKSFVAKAISSAWKIPMVKLDLGKIYGSLVGESEGNMREALEVAEAVSPCVLMVDEIEKGLAGSSGGGKNDSGVSSRVFGYLLNWMQDRKADVFVVATANQISQLPPEFLRKGRFDELFFVDLPNDEERKEIFKIHIEKKNRKSSEFDIDRLSNITDGFTGSEIEESVKSSLFVSFSKDRELKTKDIDGVLQKMIPLSKTMEKELNAIREWSDGRAVNVSTKINSNKMKVKRVRKLSKNK